MTYLARHSRRRRQEKDAKNRQQQRQQHYHTAVPTAISSLVAELTCGYAQRVTDA